MPDDADIPPRKVPLLNREDLAPRDRQRIGRAASALLSVGLFATAVFGILVIWHLIRRGRLIRARLDPPKVIRLPDFSSSDSPPGEST